MGQSARRYGTAGTSDSKAASCAVAAGLLLAAGTVREARQTIASIGGALDAPVQDRNSRDEYDQFARARRRSALSARRHSGRGLSGTLWSDSAGGAGSRERSSLVPPEHCLRQHELARSAPRRHRPGRDRGRGTDRKTTARTMDAAERSVW